METDLTNSSLLLNNCTSSNNQTESIMNETTFLDWNLTCNASAVNSNSSYYTYDQLVVELARILYVLVCLVGLCGNTLVIYVVLRFSKMQTVTNMYIFNLAVADEMFLIGLPFLVATLTFKSWRFGQAICKIYMTTTSINQFTSSLLLTVMSADRYVAVCHPISSPRYRTPFIAKFICLTTWTVSALLMVPIFMYANADTIHNTTSCNIFWPEYDIMNGQKAFTLYSFTLGFFIPFILILLFYFLVICKLRKVGPKSRSKEKKKSHRKVTILVLTVITVYVMCWLPYWIGQLYVVFIKSPPKSNTTENPDSSEKLGMIFLLLAGCLSYANSAINPILYAFLSENFKKSFAKAFTCAAGKDVNAQLHVENSVFPRTTRGSTKSSALRHREGIETEQQGFSNICVQRDENDQAMDDKEQVGISCTSKSQFLCEDRQGLLRNGFENKPSNSEISENTEL
ncbi:Somatostatin receptor type 1-like protein [Leptotrombidium deliense]|uniref:Somatostatin receptor type 1-like protein n=1 Tax=Leptotrombidium deliense TaxID=299467 RepID=A0A443S9D1_9ACAR|nr:Somatostatin receptor type 1-like protein [Leptotrombidium deliense]